jgi:phospholipase C
VDLGELALDVLVEGDEDQALVQLARRVETAAVVEAAPQDTGLVTKKAPDTAVSPDEQPLPPPHGGGNSSQGAGAANGGQPVAAHSSGFSKSAAPKVRLRCATKGHGRTVTVTCVARGAGSAKTTALRFRIVRGGKVLATAATRLRHARATVVLHARRALRKGTYVLRVTITQRGSVSATQSTVRLG